MAGVTDTGWVDHADELVRGPQPTLTGSRVALRAWTVSDAEDVFVACQDAAIQRWTTVPIPYTREHATEFVTTTAAEVWAGGGALFAVVDPSSAELVASMGAHRVHNGVAEVGYWTRAESRRRGLTADALRTLTRWLFAECDVARAELVIEPGNAASIALAESVGFVREGLLRQRFLLRGDRVDGCIFGLVATDPAAAQL
jgi:RimJ/RimL family protein N-acetyltransferase